MPYRFRRGYNRSLMQLSIAFSLCCTGSLLLAQSSAPPAKNLKVLAADVDVMDTMRGFNEALGVRCDYCHAPNDFASDANPRKETARKMIALVRQTEPFF